MLLRYLLSLTTALRYSQKMWSGPEVDKLLHLLIADLNSSLEKGGYVMIGFDGSLSKKSRLICQFCFELYIWCNACQRSLISMHGYLLKWIASIAGSLCFLTQFMRFQGFWFFEAIS